MTVNVMLQVKCANVTQLDVTQTEAKLDVSSSVVTLAHSTFSIKLTDM